ncbi:MAG TPA: response regulator [Polyangiaceae bacterium]|nr:response regulator [Polyangiaceae bacterium]
MNVLVVDDSAAMRKIIISALGKTELRGARTIEATNGKEGLDKFLDGNFGVILSDWNMPEMDGIEFVNRVRKVDSRVKIIMITTEGTMGKLESALDGGVDEYVVKPFTPETLDRKIKKVLGVKS